MVENGRRKGGRGTNGLCVVTKTNAGKTVKVWRGEGGDCLTIFCGSSTEIIGWLEERREDGECEKCVEGE